MTTEAPLPDVGVPGLDTLPFERPTWPATHAAPRTRVVYAAAHVAAHPDGTIDWESTLGFRDHLWDHGFGLADAMDTAQRGMGLSWSMTRELIARSGARARERDARLAAGAGTDQLADGEPHDLRTIRAAYREQLSVVADAEATPILMASRALARSDASPDDYVELYAGLIEDASAPVILHWLGEVFDPALQGYWGCADHSDAAEVVLRIIEAVPGRVDGVKVSLLEPAYELALRARLPEHVRLYTGDDFNFAGLIKGDAAGHSDALLGVFAAIAAPAASALAALDEGDRATYDAVMGPCEDLGRLLFEAPTSAYKAGVAFLAWLNGFQPHFSMLDHFEQRRPAEHYVRVFEQAARCGALLEPDLATARLQQLLAGA